MFIRPPIEPNEFTIDLIVQHGTLDRTKLPKEEWMCKILYYGFSDKDEKWDRIKNIPRRYFYETVARMAH